MNFKKIFKITELEIQNSPILIKIANSICTTGRIQDLSEGGARFISEQKHTYLGIFFTTGQIQDIHIMEQKIDIFPVLH